MLKFKAPKALIKKEETKSQVPVKITEKHKKKQKLEKVEVPKIVKTETKKPV
jgi:hypothetical protein